MRHMYTWINGIGESRKRSTLERLRKEAVRDHKNIRLSGEGGVGGAEGSTGQNYGHQAQAAVQGYIQNLPGLGGGRSSDSHPSAFAPSYDAGFPNIPGIPGQLPNLFSGSGFGNREAPEDAPLQPSPYAPSYPPAQPSYDDGSYRSIPPEPSLDQPTTYAQPYAPSYTPDYPEPPGGGYQPSYDTPPQFGFSGGTGGYGNVGSGFGGGFGFGWPPQPQPQPQDEGTSSDAWQGDEQYGFSGGTPGLPDPQRRFGF